MYNGASAAVRVLPYLKIIALTQGRVTIYRNGLQRTILIMLRAKHFNNTTKTNFTRTKPFARNIEIFSINISCQFTDDVATHLTRHMFINNKNPEFCVCEYLCERIHQ